MVCLVCHKRFDRHHKGQLRPNFVEMSIVCALNYMGIPPGFTVPPTDNGDTNYTMLIQIGVLTSLKKLSNLPSSV